MYDITPIKNYILFLKESHKLSVTVHPMVYKSVLVTGAMRAFNIHGNSYCAYLKTCHEATEKCQLKQERVFEKSKGGAYTGVCYAGVKERVYPIKTGDEPVGFISVSGYKAENWEERVKKTALSFNLPERELSRAYGALTTEFPEERELDALIYPLCQMLELALIRSEEEIKSTEIPFARRVVRYIKSNRNREITSATLCREFSCSRSKLSLEFNKFMGKSIRDYINELRIEDAKTLLKHTSLTSTEIAYSVGYTDSNYFSSLFKKSTGLTPLAYRKRG